MRVNNQCSSFLVCEITEAVVVFLFIHETRAGVPCYSQLSSFSWQEGQRVPQLPPPLQEQAAPIPYLAAGCGWGQNHQGWFFSLEFPQGYCVHLLRTAEEKGLFWQLLLFRANFKWWALSCKLSFVTLKWCAIICLLSSFSLCWLLPGVLCVTCIFGRVCAICWTLSFNFPWQIKSLLSRKCLCENEVTHGIMRQYLHSLLIWVNLLVILSQYQINSGPLKC